MTDCGLRLFVDTGQGDWRLIAVAPDEHEMVIAMEAFIRASPALADAMAILVDGETVFH